MITFKILLNQWQLSIGGCPSTWTGGLSIEILEVGVEESLLVGKILVDNSSKSTEIGVSDVVWVKKINIRTKEIITPNTF